MQRLNAHGNITALVTPQMKSAQDTMLATISAVNTNHSAVAKRGLFLTGSAQAGKSTILISFGQALEHDLRKAKGLTITDTGRPPRDARGNLYVPIVYALCSSSVGGTLSGILGFFEEHAARMRIPEMISRVSFLINTCDTRVLILDQAQELGSSKARMSEQSEFLKSLLDNNPGLTILGGGIDLPKLPLFQTSSTPTLRQTAHRFPLHEVAPYPMDKPSDVAPLLKAIEKRLILLNQPKDSLAQLADEVLKATNGVTGLIVNLVRDAAQHAIQSGEERITKRSLLQARKTPIRGMKVVP